MVVAFDINLPRFNIIKIIKVILINQILEREEIRLIIDENESFTSECIQIKDGDNWVSIIGSNEGFSTLNFRSRYDIYKVPCSFQNETENKLFYKLDDKFLSLNLEYSIEQNNIIHIKYSLSNKKKIFISQYGVNYAIFLGNNPDFTWAIHLRPKEGLIMGDHVYRSPVIIYKKLDYAFAFIPDLDILGKNRPYRSFIDFNLKSREFNGTPQLFYGFGDYKPVGHIFFKHKPMKRWKLRANSDLTFGYFIILFKGKPIKEILESVNTFLWQKYGSRLFKSSLEPQVIPYDKNAEEGFKAIIERHKIWGDFNINGEKCGGFWQTSWMGKKKSKINFIQPEEFSIEDQIKKNMSQLVSKESFLSKLIMSLSNSPFWIKRFEWFTQTFPVIKRNAEVWFNAWFNNMRSAYGFRYFGELWNNNDLKEKGERIFNTFLNIPRIRGISPSVILPSSLGDAELSIIKGLQGFLYIDMYSIVDCSITLFWALKFSKDFNIKREKIKEISDDFFNLLKEIQLENGEIPAYIDFKEDNNTPIISDILKNSASSGAPLMFMMEYYNQFKNNDVILVAEKIANYIISEIIPEDKWHDFEPFYSCTHLPLDFYDDYTKKHVMNCLCIYWCADGFKELFKITSKPQYLETGERILSILSLFQQIWNLPYISYNTFGGFASQNADAELSDARQALFVRLYMEYYLITGKIEYMERAIATLRASWAMQMLREYAEICPGNVLGVRTLDGVDRGIVVENYGHSGNDLRVPGYWMADWGFGTSVSATAFSKKHFGDLFIDFKEKNVFGIDGILINSYQINPNEVNIDCKIINDKDYIIILGRDVPSDKINIILNGKSIKIKSKEELESGFQYKI